MDKYLEYIKVNNINNNLHDLVLNTRKHKILEKYIKIYLQTEKGKNELNTNTIKSALMLALQFSEILLSTNTNGSALMLASLFSKTLSTNKTVKILIKAKANLDLQDEHGHTALMLASQFSRTLSTNKTVEILIKAGANLDLQDECGHTALMIASINTNTNSCEETVKILIKAGANLDLQQFRDQNTALLLASNYVNEFRISTKGTVKILISAGANLYLQNKFGYTALMFWLIYFDLDFIKKYLNYYKISGSILQKFASHHKIPIETYEFLVDQKIIKHIISEYYSKSKYNIIIPIELDFLEFYKIHFDNCISCMQDKNTVICTCKHSICFRCLHFNNYMCLICEKFGEESMLEYQ